MNKDQLKQEIQTRLKQEYRRAEEMLSQMVRFPSVSGCEAEAQAYMAERFKEWGCEVDEWIPRKEELAAYPGFLTRRDSFDGSPNVVGTRRGTGGGRSLILNSHIDVVPSGDDGWNHGPWSGKVVNGEIFGRGTTDMKGGGVSVFFPVAIIHEMGIELAGDLILQSVIEEEAGGAGTLACVARGYKADGALIPEPSDMKLYPASMGSMWFRITVPGRAAHGATAYLGINAVEKAHIISSAIKKLERDRNKPPQNSLYAHMPVPFCINIGSLQGGNWPSSVPEKAVMEGRMGVSPDESVTEAREQLERAVSEAAKTDPWLRDNPPRLEWFGSCWHSGGIDPDHDLSRTLQRAYRDNFHREPRIEGAPWATDAAALIRFGNTPTVVFGPGRGHLAHQTNESIRIADMLQVSLTTADFILDWCGLG